MFLKFVIALLAVTAAAYGFDAALNSSDVDAHWEAQIVFMIKNI